MRTDVQPVGERHPSIMRRAVAALVLIAAVALAIHLVIGVVMAVFYFLAILAVIVAVLWALKTIFW